MMLAALVLASLPAMPFPADAGAPAASLSALSALPAIAEAPGRAAITGPGPGDFPGTLDAIFPGWRDDTAAQVRIERHIIIRIAPRPPVEPRMLFAFPRPDPRTRPIERRMGDCVDTSGIAGMIPDQDQRLILYMRDGQMISMVLERACQARDFYSGFYFARQPDGKLCVGRDTLLSRNGVNCRLTRIRRLTFTPR